MEEKFKYDVQIRQHEHTVKMLFSCDCGKFGTDEILDEFEVTPEELLIALQKHRGSSENKEELDKQIEAACEAYKPITEQLLREGW